MYPLPLLPLGVRVGQPIAAIAAASVPFGSIANYAFDFGTGAPVVSGSSSTATYTYTTSGTYQVTAWVTSSRGGVARVTQTITVVSVPSNSSPPSLLGAAVEGKTLVESHGVWSDGPIVRYWYQ